MWFSIQTIQECILDHIIEPPTGTLLNYSANIYASGRKVSSFWSQTWHVSQISANHCTWAWGALPLERMPQSHIWFFGDTSATLWLILQLDLTPPQTAVKVKAHTNNSQHAVPVTCSAFRISVTSYHYLSLKQFKTIMKSPSQKIYISDTRPL